MRPILASDGPVVALVQSLRPHQWVKNAFVLAPLFFAGVLRDAGKVGRAVAAAFFCLASSAVYLLNDMADRDADRHHPRKRHRPGDGGPAPR